MKDSIPKQRPSRIPNKMLPLILDYCYRNTVDNPISLNKTKPFGSNVYGETTNDTMLMLLEHLEIKQTDVFLDLGSGIGETVLVVAAASCINRAYGIEMMQIHGMVQFRDKRVQPYVWWFSCRKFSKCFRGGNDCLYQQFFIRLWAKQLDKTMVDQQKEWYTRHHHSVIV